MTYPEIRQELLEIKASANPDVSRAKELIGELTSIGISPRRVGLNLRRLGLSPRQQGPSSGRTKRSRSRP
jgi:hypothetical protein